MRVRRSVSSTGSTAYGRRRARARAPGSLASRSARGGCARARGGRRRSCAHLGPRASAARRLRPQAERVADGVGELGAIERVEMKLADAVRARAPAPARSRRSRRSGGASRHRPPGPRSARAATAGMPAPQRSAKRHTCAKRVMGRMPGTIGALMPAAAQRSRKRRKTCGVIEELRDRAGRAGVDLALEVVEIGLRRAGLRVHLRIGGDRDVKRRDARERRHQFRGVREALRGAAGSARLPWGASPRSATRWRMP